MSVKLLVLLSMLNLGVESLLPKEGKNYFVYDKDSQKIYHLCATVYEHSCREGRAYSIYANETISQLPREYDEVISAVYIYPGCRLEAFYEPDFEGSFYNQTSSGYYALPRHNDKFSSVKCFCKPIQNFIPIFAISGEGLDDAIIDAEVDYGRGSSWGLHLLHFILELSALGWICYFNKGLIQSKVEPLWRIVQARLTSSEIPPNQAPKFESNNAGIVVESL